MTETKRTGIYVHIPFCKRKCNYCDFCSFAETKEEREAYIKALISEIYEYGGGEICADTVFFGGGTPSLLTPEEFSRISDALRESFVISENAEFTVECNPKTLTPQKLAAYKRARVNRLSIGLQSANEAELKTLGRIHSFEDFLSSYEMARAAGFDNISLDLMYGLPGQTAESFEKTLESVIALSPEHISAYGLIVEPGTLFFEKRDELLFPSEDEECDMYSLACKKLSEAGYSHYEISNYAKPGKACLHNLKYWKNLEYIGLGLAAHSYFDGKRYSNTADMAKYLSLNFEKQRAYDRERESLDPFEYAMLALRLSEGLSLDEYKSLFSESFLDGKERLIERFIKEGLMGTFENRLFFTEKGFYLSNSILSEIL